MFEMNSALRQIYGDIENKSRVESESYFSQC